MNLNRSHLFIGITSIALIIVLMIQVNWIFKTASIKEELFNEKANMVLSRTVEDLKADEETSRQLGLCIGRNEINTIDLLLSKNMEFYNVSMDYSFELITPDTKNTNDGPLENNVYKKRLDEVASANGLELKLVFPGKEQFVLAEMGTMFITSVLLIVVVLVLLWRTILSLQRQEKMSVHTTDFLNNMTHELKTPLTNIALAGRMMIKDANIRKEEKIRHYSGIILGENEKLRLQVEQVLTRCGLERGELPMHKTELDIHHVINDALKFISVQIENKSGSVSLHLSAKETVVMGDKIHLTNAISNLVDNAIKYSPDRPELLIQTSSENQLLTIVIADKGVGIDMKYHKKIFQQFFRIPTGDIHNVKGFGMGLAYTKTVLELHGGKIAVSSVKGEGTAFILTLPNA